MTAITSAGASSKSSNRPWARVSPPYPEKSIVAGSRLLQPVFTRERIAQYAVIMRTAAEEATRNWQDAEVLALDEVMNDLALTALTRSLFRITVHADTADVIKHGMQSLTQGLLLRTVLPSAWDQYVWPKLHGLLREHRDLHVELINDYGLSNIVAERFDIGVRLGDQVEKDMISVTREIA